MQSTVPPSPLKYLETSRGDIIRYLIAVYKSLGGGWESRVGKKIIPEQTLDTMRKRTDWGGFADARFITG